jgi:hypothetical protein
VLKPADVPQPPSSSDEGNGAVDTNTEGSSQ